MVCLQDAGPRVSVVTAVHDGAAHIRDAIQSILAQTFADFEYLIIDDGSIDQTPAILREVAASDPRVTVLTQQQMGIPKTLNEGTTLARGKYIARQDGDDISLPQRLAKQVDFLERHPDHAAVGSFVHWIDARGTWTRSVDFPVDDADIRREVFSFACCVHGALLIRRDALQAVGGYRVEFPISEDYDLYLRLLERFRVANLAEFLYSYRAHAESLTGGMRALTQHYVEIARLLAYQRRETGKDLLMLGSNPASIRDAG
jgi:glycosyltransferase involved in cell wall biosynthesis